MRSSNETDKGVLVSLTIVGYMSVHFGYKVPQQHWSGTTGLSH